MARRTRISLLSCALALAVAGCGSGDDGTIPPDDANQLLSLLAAVEQEASTGDCDTAQSLANQFVTSVNDLPNDVDSEVAGELTKAASNLEGLTEKPGECTETGATGELGDQPAPSTTTTTTPETTTQESSTTTEESSTTTLDEPEEQPSEDPNQEPPTGSDQGGDTGGGTGGGTPPSGGVTGGGSAG